MACHSWTWRKTFGTFILANNNLWRPTKPLKWQINGDCPAEIPQCPVLVPSFRFRSRGKDLLDSQICLSKWERYSHSQIKMCFLWYLSSSSSWTQILIQFGSLFALYAPFFLDLHTVRDVFIQTGSWCSLPWDIKTMRLTDRHLYHFCSFVFKAFQKRHTQPIKNEVDMCLAFKNPKTSKLSWTKAEGYVIWIQHLV